MSSQAVYAHGRPVHAVSQKSLVWRCADLGARQLLALRDEVLLHSVHQRRCLHARLLHGSGFLRTTQVAFRVQGLGLRVSCHLLHNNT